MYQLLGFLISLNLFAITITEEDISRFTRTSNPNLQKIEAQALEAKKNYLAAEDSLGVKLYGGYKHETTREKALNPFIPVFSPVNQYQIGLSKKSQYGIESKLEASVDSRTANNFNSVNTSMVSLELGFDLWSNFLGRISKRELENAKLSKEQMKIKEGLDLKALESKNRKIFWAIVANEEKKKLTQKLFSTAKKQAKDARKRLKSSVADKTEVSRYDSQVSMREGQLYLLDYERERLAAQLRMQFPQLANQKIKIGKYNLDKTIFEVLSCTQQINSKTKTPYEYSEYDELLSYLSKIQANQEKIDTSSSIDLKLVTKFKTTGVASDEVSPGQYEGSFEDSLDDIEQNNRTGLEAALMFTIPLGSTSNELKEVNTLVNKKRLSAQLLEAKTSMHSTHEQVTKSIEILRNVIRSQKENSKSLNIRVKDMKKKYSQARIPLYALIQDQDELMNNDLNVIDTQITILNTLLDYFIVFNKTPCAFNRI
jgi:outer membrane protein TolC